MPPKIMRSSPKITRVQLKINQNNESVLVGIVSSEPDYKLSLALNRKLKIALKNVNPLTVTDENGSESAFSRFSDTSSSHGTTYDLTSNRNEKNFLIKKLKNIDYFFQIHNPENSKSADAVIALLRVTESVTAVLNIDIKTLKDKTLHFLIQ
jgi:hypothetical protein